MVEKTEVVSTDCRISLHEHISWYKLSGKRLFGIHLSGKVMVQETSCTGNNQQDTKTQTSGKLLVWETYIPEMSSPETSVIWLALPIAQSLSVAFTVATGFPLTWKTWKTHGILYTWKTPGKLLEFYARPGIFGIISRFMLVITL